MELPYALDLCLSHGSKSERGYLNTLIQKQLKVLIEIQIMPF